VHASASTAQCAAAGVHCTVVCGTAGGTAQATVATGGQAAAGELRDGQHLATTINQAALFS